MFRNVSRNYLTEILIGFTELKQYNMYIILNILDVNTINYKQVL